MDTIYQRVAGLDLHKETIVAAVRCMNSAGKLEAELRTFGTMTRDLLELSDWLTARNVTHVTNGSHRSPQEACVEQTRRPQRVACRQSA